MVTIKHVFAAIDQQPHESALLVGGYFSTNLAAPKGSNYVLEFRIFVPNPGGIPELGPKKH